MTKNCKTCLATNQNQSHAQIEEFWKIILSIMLPASWFEKHEQLQQVQEQTFPNSGTNLIGVIYKLAQRQPIGPSCK